MDSISSLTGLRCTESTRRQYQDISPHALPVREPAACSDFWYVHFMSIEKRNCLLFMHESSQYSLLAIALSTTRLVQIKRVFHDALRQHFRSSLFEQNAIERLEMEWASTCYIAQTQPQHLGKLQDLLKFYRHFVTLQGGILRCDIELIHHQINNQLAGTESITPAQKLGRRYQLQWRYEQVTE